MKENKLVCVICGFEGYRLSRSHLPKIHNLTAEEYYIYYILQSYLPPKCLNRKCNNLVKFRDLGRGFNSTCSISCHVSYQQSCDNTFVRLCKDQIFKEKRDKARLKAVEESRRNKPEVWKKVSLAVSESLKRKWKEDLDYRSKMTKLISNMINDPNSGVGFKNLMINGHPKVGFAKLWEDEEFRKKTTVSIKGYHESIKCGVVPYRSSLELRFMELLDHNDEIDCYEYEPVGIPYKFQGRDHKYYPDFLITWKDGTQEVIEIKPSCNINTSKNVAKFNAVQEFYEESMVKFNILTETTLSLSDGG